MLTSRAGDRESRILVPCPEHREGDNRVAHSIVGFQVPGGQEAGAQWRPLAIVEARGVHCILDHADLISIPDKDLLEVLRRNDDLVHHSQPGMNQFPPTCQMIRRFTTVIVEDLTLPQAPRDQDRGDRREQKRPVRRREHVHHIRMTQP